MLSSWTRQKVGTDHNFWYVLFRCEDCGCAHSNGGHSKQWVNTVAEQYRILGQFITVGYGNVRV